MCFPNCVLSRARTVKSAPTRDTQYRKATSTVYFAMTQLESIVVEAARGAMWRCGWKGDATTGDGVLVRPVGEQAWNGTPTDLCRQIAIDVHAATGVRVAFCLKRVDGSRVPPREGVPCFAKLTELDFENIFHFFPKIQIL